MLTIHASARSVCTMIWNWKSYMLASRDEKGEYWMQSMWWASCFCVFHIYLFSFLPFCHGFECRKWSNAFRLGEYTRHRYIRMYANLYLPCNVTNKTWIIISFIMKSEFSLHLSMGHCPLPNGKLRSSTGRSDSEEIQLIDSAMLSYTNYSNSHYTDMRLSSKMVFSENICARIERFFWKQVIVWDRPLQIAHARKVLWKNFKDFHTWRFFSSSFFAEMNIVHKIKTTNPLLLDPVVHTHRQLNTAVELLRPHRQIHKYILLRRQRHLWERLAWLSGCISRCSYVGVVLLLPLRRGME